LLFRHLFPDNLMDEGLQNHICIYSTNLYTYRANFTTVPPKWRKQKTRWRAGFEWHG
jgi:hypothetical protein